MVSKTGSEAKLLVDRKSQTWTRIILGACIFIMVAYLVGAAIFLVFNQPLQRVQNHSNQTSKSQIGSSAGWKKVAEYFDEAVDFQVDPCDNFFRFACGQYVNGQKSPPMSRVGIKLAEDLREAIDRYKVTPDTPRTLKQAKDAYQKCLTASPSETNLTMVLPYIKQFGGWPLVFQKQKVNASWNAYTFMGYLNSLTVNNILSATPMPNWKDPEKGNMVFIDQAETLIPLAIYQSPLVDDSSSSTKYQIFDTAQLFAGAFGLGRLDDNQLRNDIDLMMMLDYRLAFAGDRGFPTRDNWAKSFNSFNIKSAKQKWPDIEWEKYLRALAGKNIDPDKMIRKPFSVMLPRFMKVVSELPLRPGQDAAVAQNYLVYKFIQKVMSILPQFEEQYRKLKQMEAIRNPKLVHEAIPSGRKDVCANLVNGFLPFAMSRLYVDYRFRKEPGKIIGKLTEMSDFVLEAFGNIVNNLTWMDKSTKFNAKKKILNLVKNIGYPEWIMDDELLDAKHPEDRLNIVKGDHIFELYVKLGSYKAWFDWHKFLEPVNRFTFGYPPTMVNAWYQSYYNSITFSAAFIQQPTFDVNFPMTFNFGAIGSVMGHELVHGFDNHGSLFDEIGKLHNWMTKKSSWGYDGMKSCLSAQFDDYCYPEYNICVDGHLTLGENIADNGGLASAYMAYKSYVELSGEEPRLPGKWSQFTMEQIFFLSHSYLWCSSDTQDPKSQILTDIHSPNKFRVIGSLRNFPPFAKAFNCRPDSSMAPTKHCNGWWS